MPHLHDDNLEVVDCFHNVCDEVVFDKHRGYAGFRAVQAAPQAQGRWKTELNERAGAAASVRK